MYLKWFQNDKPGDVSDTLAEANNTATDSMWTCNNTLQSTQRKIFVASFDESNIRCSKDDRTFKIKRRSWNI